MTAKKYLAQLEHIDDETENLIDALNRTKDRLVSARGALLSDMPKGRPPRGMEDAYAAYEDLRSKVNKYVANLCRLKADIIDAIFSIDDGLLRDVLEKRYMLYMDWESIRQALKYKEIKSVYNLHGKALLKIEEKIH